MQESADPLLSVRGFDQFFQINFLSPRKSLVKVNCVPRIHGFLSMSESRHTQGTKFFKRFLNDARDFRQLAIDILTLKTESGPTGVQVRPGVWVEPRAVIEKGARVLAPAFIGAHAKVRSHAVITRCSTVEHHAQVDCGTVAENSSVLSHCYVGAGLDLAHSVAASGRIANLLRDVNIEIYDPKLVGSALGSPLERLARAATELAIYIPRQAWRGMFGKAPQPQSDLQTALHQTSPALGSAAGYQAPACDSRAATKFPNLAIVRRYGHQ